MLKQRVFAFLSVVVFLSSGCGKASGSQAAGVVEEYVRALAGKDAARLAALSCAEW